MRTRIQIFTGKSYGTAQFCRQSQMYDYINLIHMENKENMENEEKKTYLLIGSNLGNRTENLRKAREELKIRVGSDMKVSLVYASEAWGNKFQANFLNQAVGVNTSLTPRELLNTVLEIEKDLGRGRGRETNAMEKWHERIIDIDILLYQKEILCEAGLTIPHSLMLWRRFSLLPLAEIAPNVTHPILHRTVAQVLEVCVDTLKVYPYEDEDEDEDETEEVEGVEGIE